MPLWLACDQIVSARLILSAAKANLEHMFCEMKSVMKGNAGPEMLNNFFQFPGMDSSNVSYFVTQMLTWFIVSYSEIHKPSIV